MDLYICHECGHEVLSNELPQKIKWTDGHTCRFRKATKEENHPDRGHPIRGNDKRRKP